MRKIILEDAIDEFNTWAFRWVTEDGECQWIGIAFATNINDLFQAIDHHECPYSCQIRPVFKEPLSICHRESQHDDDDGETEINFDWYWNHYKPDRVEYFIPDWHGIEYYYEDEGHTLGLEAVDLDELVESEWSKHE